LTITERLHFLHRAWRYRLRSEPQGIRVLLGGDLTDKTAVDIGAHRGVYSYWMHRAVGRHGQVLAFEPQPELAAYLEDAKQAFRLDRMVIVNAGLSNQSGQRELVRPRHHWGAASLCGSSTEATDMLPVQVTTLDEYISAHPAPPIKFIKCDVERHEFEVFQGAQQVLRRDRPVLVFECHDPQDGRCATFNFLAGLDYDGFCFVRRGVAPVAQYPALRAKLPRSALLNFLFVPREGTPGVRFDRR
jgi:FkbM family methyltransferase